MATLTVKSVLSTAALADYVILNVPRPQFDTAASFTLAIGSLFSNYLHCAV
jgi:hypothetical protein